MELGLTSRIKFSLELSYAALRTPVGAILQPAKTSFLVPAKTSTVHLGTLGYQEAGIAGAALLNKNVAT